MACLKCGQQTQDNEVFCPDCLDAMAQCPPIKPGTPVTLPQRRSNIRKNPSVKQPKLEKVVADLQKKVRRLWIAVCVLCVLLAVSAGSLGYLIWQNYHEPAIGSNYHTVSADADSIE